MSQPTFKDIDACARWLSHHHLPDAQVNAELVEDLAFFVASTRHVERQKCADVCEGMIIGGRQWTEGQAVAASALSAAASRIRGLASQEPCNAPEDK